MRLINRVLFLILSLRGYLQCVSSLLLLYIRCGLGKHNPATEYIHHLGRLVSHGGVAIDIGANLGYYTLPLSKIVGDKGVVHGVEPVPLIFDVLSHNTRRTKNVILHNVALGASSAQITIANSSVRESGYMGTGRNFVKEGQAKEDLEFSARMVRGSELFGSLEQIDLIKCDIEGYECIVMEEIKPLLERHHPVVLIESGGENRAKIIELFTSLGYSGYTLHRGVEIPLGGGSEKDIIFRYESQCE